MAYSYDPFSGDPDLVDAAWEYPIRDEMATLEGIATSPERPVSPRGLLSVEEARLAGLDAPPWAQHAQAIGEQVVGLRDESQWFSGDEDARFSVRGPDEDAGGIGMPSGRVAWTDDKGVTTYIDEGQNQDWADEVQSDNPFDVSDLPPESQAKVHDAMRAGLGEEQRYARGVQSLAAKREELTAARAKLESMAETVPSGAELRAMRDYVREVERGADPNMLKPTSLGGMGSGPEVYKLAKQRIADAERFEALDAALDAQEAGVGSRMEEIAKFNPGEASKRRAIEQIKIEREGVAEDSRKQAEKDAKAEGSSKKALAGLWEKRLTAIKAKAKAEASDLYKVERAKLEEEFGSALPAEAVAKLQKIERDAYQKSFEKQGGPGLRKKVAGYQAAREAELTFGADPATIQKIKEDPRFAEAVERFGSEEAAIKAALSRQK